MHPTTFIYTFFALASSVQAAPVADGGDWDVVVATSYVTETVVLDAPEQTGSGRAGRFAWRQGSGSGTWPAFDWTQNSDVQIEPVFMTNFVTVTRTEMDQAGPTSTSSSKSSSSTTSITVASAIQNSPVREPVVLKQKSPLPSSAPQAAAKKNVQPVAPLPVSPPQGLAAVPAAPVVPKVAASNALPPSDNSNAKQAMIESVLQTHNSYRALHSAPALQWDNTLADYAASHAASCVFKHTGGPYGENLAEGYGSPALGIKAWYDEQSQYSYSRPGFSSATGHFTQLVWKETTKIGCANIDCRSSLGGYFLMCEYQKAGNVGMGGSDPNILYRQNVLPN